MRLLGNRWPSAVVLPISALANLRIGWLARSLRREFSLIVAVVLAVLLVGVAYAQTPLDLFPDNPQLAADFVRVCSWNLRHINLEEQARQLLPGQNDTEDFAILIATFAKGFQDLGCDVAAVTEVQPRANEPDRLLQIRDRLNGTGTGTWQIAQTNIDYDAPAGPFGNLQLGVLWNSTKVTIVPTSAQLLNALRQPRDANGALTERRMRVPWLVPVRTGALDFDLLILHLKSGGEAPQAAEVDALQTFITARQSGPAPRHLIILGDWNIRPDQSTGRSRLRRMMAPTPTGNLMRVLTVEDLAPRLDGWDGIDGVPFNTPLARVLPFSHFNATSLDTLLDHIAISRTLDEVYDHPVRVQRADGGTDLQPGIQIAEPLIQEEQYRNLTDHLPVVLTLRTTVATPPLLPTAGTLRIVAALPNPHGDDAQLEEVHVMNSGSAAVPLAGWRVTNAAGQQAWQLTAQDGIVPPEQVVIIVRQGRPMSLRNTGDTIVLVNTAGQTVDTKSYGQASSGQLFVFE